MTQPDFTAGQMTPLDDARNMYGKIGKKMIALIGRELPVSDSELDRFRNHLSLIPLDLIKRNNFKMHGQLSKSLQRLFLSREYTRFMMQAQYAHCNTDPSWTEAASVGSGWFETFCCLFNSLVYVEKPDTAGTMIVILNDYVVATTPMVYVNEGGEHKWTAPNLDDELRELLFNPQPNQELDRMLNNIANKQRTKKH